MSMMMDDKILEQVRHFNYLWCNIPQLWQRYR